MSSLQPRELGLILLPATDGCDIVRVRAHDLQTLSSCATQEPSNNTAMRLHRYHKYQLCNFVIVIMKHWILQH